MDSNKYTADKLKEFREKRNLTQKELAEDLNITQQQVARYENNQRKFKIEFLLKLSNYFQISVKEFFPKNMENSNESDNFNINKFIGEKICWFRAQKNITQAELAEELNVTSQTISRYELGDRKPSQETLFKLAKIFNVNIGEFYPKANEEKKREEFNIFFNKYKNLSKQDKELIDTIIETRTNQINNDK